ncbi:MAG: hypothetical protein HDT12_04435 [Helicobacter sp.]|nr:hypothetical protein [Helicobacter sp.]
MGKNFLKDESNALLVQKHQLQKTHGKLVEINSTLDLLLEKQKNDIENVDKFISNMDVLLEEIGYNKKCVLSEDEEKRYLVALQAELDSMPSEVESVRLIDELDVVDFDETMSFSDYIDSFEAYAQRNGLDLTRDPFDSLMSKTQQIELQKRIREEFSYKNAQCDKYDYLIAGTCGVIGGIIDIVFVGAPGQSKLGNFTDEMANKATEQFARLCGWEGEGTKSAIGFLENKFRVNYDQSTTSGKKNSTNGKVSNLSMKNHHLKSLGHSPDPIGLFFSILNQFTNTSTFLSNGQLITIDTENFELQGGNFIAKVFCGFANWLGHLMSDWTGSSGAQGRGSGIPIPFYNLFQLCDFGRFGEKGQETFAVITSKVFEQGYDFRHGMAMAIPVIVTELLIRLMYVVKARFYHGKDWKECMPNASIPELRRMLLVGHGALCAIDGVDAAVRSGNPIVNPVEFLLRTNLIGWVRFGYLSLKEVGAWWNEGKIDEEALDKYLDEDLQRMLQC